MARSLVHDQYLFSHCSVVTRYHNDPRAMQYISKHFFYEEVFDDSTSDRPKIRWRYRNFFSDDVAHSQRTHGNDNNVHENSHRDSSAHQRDSYGDSDDKGNAHEFKPVLVSFIIQFLPPSD